MLQDQLKMMQDEFDIARQNFGSTEKIYQQGTGKKQGFFSKLFKGQRHKAGDSTGDPQQVILGMIWYLILWKKSLN